MGSGNYGRHGEEEGGKDEDGIDSSGCKKDRVSTYQLTSDRISYRSLDSAPTGGFERHWKWSGQIAGKRESLRPRRAEDHRRRRRGN
jgi:hypothetical protein